MRFLAILVLGSMSWAQGLPAYVIGVGISDNRGAAGTPWGVDITFAEAIAKTPLYWWSNMSTPLTKGTPGNPTPSTITTGGAWVVGDSTWRVKPTLILQSGLSIGGTHAVGMASVAAAFSGSIGFSIYLGHGWSLFPYVKAIATSTGQNGAANTVAQPGLELQYVLGK